MSRIVQHLPSANAAEVVLVCARFSPRHTKKTKTPAVLACALAILVFAVGCGGGYSNGGGGGGTPPPSYTYSVLHSFTGQPDGGHPTGDVVLDPAGNLYGTTVSGGTSNSGTVFKVDTTGHETALYSFTAGVDGGFPVQAQLVRDSMGNLYSTTLQGGNLSGACNPSGCGTVFKLDPNNTESVLYDFTFADSGYLKTGLVRDAVTGNLYGTTNGSNLSGSRGMLFQLDTSNTVTVLHTFSTLPSDGASPWGDLIRDAAGNLYGTTSSGGTSNFGTVYRVDAAGTLTILYNFTGAPDGAVPLAGLVQDAGGNFYGTTVNGGVLGGTCGANLGCGVVFKLDTTLKETVLYKFTGGADGSSPFAGLIQDTAGNLYGTTTAGGATGNGVVFKLDTSNKESVLHSFTDADGSSPQGGLARDAAGNLYGTTIQGGLAGCAMVFGNSDCGVVFKLTYVP